MKNFCVYKITNKLNNKIYIGASNDFERRKKEHIANSTSKSYKFSSRLYNAFRKYGIENFDFAIIEENLDSIDEMYNREKYWIKFYDSTNKNKGYNITTGGTGGQTHDVSGKNNPMYGRHYTEEEKQQISKMLKGKPKPPGHGKKVSETLKGSHKSEEHKRNLSIANKGHLPPNIKEYKVINIYTKEILTFVSGAEMERQLGCSRKTIDRGRITKNGYKKYS